MRRHLIDHAGLRLNVLEYPAPAPDAPTVLIQHGYLDFAEAWRPVAERLTDGYRVLLADARGHGDSDHVGRGGYYHFPDYVGDLAAIIHALSPDGVHLVGHSMGGMIVSYYAGTFPERVHSLTSIEGLGPPAAEPDHAPGRMAAWIQDRERLAQRHPRRFADITEICDRLKRAQPRIRDDLLPDLARAAVQLDDSGGYRWKFDPLHQTRSPMPFYLDHAAAFWKRIPRPRLLITASDSLFGRIATDRVTLFDPDRTIEMSDCGHMVHYEAPERLADELRSFLDDACAAPS